MKKTIHSFLAVATMVALLAGCGDKQKQNDKQKTAMNSELKAFDVQKDFADNGFTFFTKNLVLCCGDSTESNAMTIGWGGIGNYLGHERPAVTVYVAPARYTYEFLERHPRFTIMEFDDPEVWKYMIEHIENCVDKRGKEYLENVFKGIVQAMGVQTPTEAITNFRCMMRQMELANPISERLQLDISLLATSVNSIRLKNNPVKLDDNAIFILYKMILGNNI